jgi:hypothetical protein
MQVSIERQVDASAAANRTVRGVADKGEGKPITEELESNYDWACWTSLNLPFALGSLYRNGKTSTAAETLRHPQNGQGTLCGRVFTCEPTGKHGREFVITTNKVKFG